MRAAVASLLLAASSAVAEDQRAFELDLFAGTSGRLYPRESEPGIVSSTNCGLAGALSIGYRSPHFVHPFVDFAWMSVSASDRRVDLGAYGGQALASRALSAWALTLGPGFDFWRVRLRLGLGLYGLLVRTDLLGERVRSSELELGYLVSVAWMAFRGSGFQAGVEARFAPVAGLALLRGATIGAFAIGLTGSWDFAAWRR